MIRISITELISNGLVEWFGDDWKRMHLPAVGQMAFMGEHRGVAARVKVPAGTTGIWVLKHGWSGVVKVRVGDSVQRVDLQSQVVDFYFVIPLSCSKPGHTEVEITVDCDPGTTSSQAQVWILGFAFGSVPSTSSKTKTLSSTTRLIEGDWGSFLALNTDQVIPTGILNHGAWGPADIELFKRHISEGDCVLDIGTHIGHHTIVFSRLVGHSGLVLSVEA